MILIGHDMGLMAQFAERMGIMYGGQLVEVGSTEEIFHHPRHPYAQLLIDSIPSFESKGNFRGIPGVGLSLLNPPSGCLFHPRCPQARDECSRVEPALEAVDKDHQVACVLYQEGADGGAA